MKLIILYFLFVHEQLLLDFDANRMLLIAYCYPDASLGWNIEKCMVCRSNVPLDVCFEYDVASK